MIKYLLNEKKIAYKYINIAAMKQKNYYLYFAEKG